MRRKTPKPRKEETKLKPSLAPSDLKAAIVRGGGDSLEGSIDNWRVTSFEVNKPMRDKKLYMLHPKVNDQIDPGWVRVFMRDVDEVEVHGELFFLQGQYE